MNNTKLRLNDKINIGKNKKILVSDLCEIKGEIFKYIKKGFWFDDEVLEKVGIKKKISNVKVEQVFVKQKKEKKETTLPKETESLKNILKSLNTLDYMEDSYNQMENKAENDENYISEYFE